MTLFTISIDYIKLKSYYTVSKPHTDAKNHSIFEFFIQKRLKQ